MKLSFRTVNNFYKFFPIKNLWQNEKDLKNFSWSSSPALILGRTLLIYSQILTSFQFVTYEIVEQLPYDQQAQVDFGEYNLRTGSGKRVRVFFSLWYYLLPATSISGLRINILPVNWLARLMSKLWK